MTTFHRLARNPAVMNGQPCVRGTRIPVSRVLELIGQYPSREELFLDYPGLAPEDLQEVLDYAALVVQDKIVPLPDKVA